MWAENIRPMKGSSEHGNESSVFHKKGGFIVKLCKNISFLKRVLSLQRQFCKNHVAYRMKCDKAPHPPPHPKKVGNPYLHNRVLPSAHISSEDKMTL